MTLPPKRDDERAPPAPDAMGADPDPKAALHRMAIELGPLLVFILVNWQVNIIAGTAAFMVAMTIAIIYSWVRTRHVAPMLWVSFGFVLVFGGLTIYLDDEKFIKIKPTITNMLFATALLGGYVFRRYYLKTLLSFAMPPMRDEGWRKLTLNWGLFFIFLAILNEIFWRTLSTEMWLNMKFATFAITLVFSGLQIGLINKYIIEPQTPAP